MSDSLNEYLCIKQEQDDQDIVEDNIGETESPTFSHEVPEQKPSTSGYNALAHGTGNSEGGSVPLDRRFYNSSSSEGGFCSASTGRKDSVACSDEQVPELKPSIWDTDEFLRRTLGIKKCSVLLERCACNSSYDGKYSSTGGNIVQQSTPYRCKKFTCPECNYSCIYKAYLRTHIDKVHKKITNFNCAECAYSCYGKSVMRNHVERTHKQLKNFSCKECTFSCYDKSAMKLHEDNFHKHLKNFICKDCTYSSNNKSNMKKHVDTIHKQLKNFNCKECTYSFYQKCRMKQHVERVHKQLKNFNCKECTYSCYDKSAMKIHVDIVHKQLKNFNCKECTYSSFYKSNIKKHVASVHK